MRCPRCCAFGPETARFCPSCGSRLDDRARAGSESDQASEYRNLTVLFCDLVESTRLTAELDPEDMAEVLSAFQRCVATVTATFGGRIARFMGDGVFAHFSYPEAHEDDAERAVMAALQMVDAVADLRTPRGQRLAARVGIATGWVMIGEGFGVSGQVEVVGEAPNLAARLQAVARPGEIVIGHRTRRLLGSGFVFDETDELTLKGFAEPIRATRVLGFRDLGSRFQSRQSRGLVPLVDRAAEVERLSESWAHTREGHGATILIAGEAGIGKSRLVEAFSESLPADTYSLVRYQSSPHHRNSALYPILRQIAHAAGIRAETSENERLSRLEDLFGAAPDRLADTIPIIAPLLGITCPPHYAPPPLGPFQIKKRTFEILIEQALGLAAKAAVLIVFEDLHWADPTTLELLDHAIPHFARHPVLMLATHRPEFQHTWREGVPIGRITLDRLDRRASGEIVRALAGEAGLATRVVEEIVHKTDGVPLFIEEMTRSILESGAGADLTGSALPVPESLHDILMARLDRFSSVKQVAQTAAVIGREFPIGLLSAIAPVQGAALQSALATLVDVGLVLRRRDSGEPQYVFKHALLQEEAYSSLLRSTRLQLHSRLAAAIETDYPAVAKREPELLAHHFTAAGNAPAAIRYWLAAGEQSVGRSAFAEAIAHLEAGLALVDQVPSGAARDRTELLLQTTLGRAYFAVKGFGAAETAAAFTRALELGRRVEDTPELFSTMHGVVAYLTVRGRFDEAYELADELVARAALQPDATPRLIAHRAVGFASFVIGRLQDAEAHLNQALAIYDPALHLPLARVLAQDVKAAALAYLLLTQVVLNREADAVRSAEIAIDHVRDLHHPHSQVAVYAFVAGMHLIRGTPEEALPLADETIMISETQGFQLWYSGGVMLRGAARSQLGEAASGIAELRDGIARMDAVGATIWGDYARLLLAEALARDGKLQPAYDEVLRGLAASEGTLGRWYEAELHRLRGDLETRLGQPAAVAQSSYRRAMVIAERQGAGLWYQRARRAEHVLCS